MGFRAQRPGGLDGAVLAEEAFVPHFFGGEYGDRLLLVNVGRYLRLDPASEPLLAPPEDCLWRVLWSSENPRYGGSGAEAPDTEESLRIPGHAPVLVPERADGRGV
jgi:maltooligosyltrehalose trehalohydrolase